MKDAKLLQKMFAKGVFFKLFKFFQKNVFEKKRIEGENMKKMFLALFIARLSGIQKVFKIIRNRNCAYKFTEKSLNAFTLR